MNKIPPSDVPVLIWVLLVTVLFTQSTALFINSRRHGHNPWLWGILGLLNFPTATVLYLIFAKKWFSKFRKKQE